ncbi:hypothetical protein INT45_011500 [Circinella minor]|uniref:Myb-like domain-containing protein n=1 Tax=Circinella minor TaxID=1195481 RepID=A0A8H7S0G9_9FUNG|nr:hypothetical protein INT45_011500 [Circinella minor]
MTPWTAKDTKLMIREKKKNPHMAWEKVSQLLGYRHTPSACSRKFIPFAPKMKKPLSLTQRRTICKFRNYVPPVTYAKIAKKLSGISTTECRFYYQKRATAKEIERGIREAKSEQAHLELLKGQQIVPEQKYSNAYTWWTETEQKKLIDLRKQEVAWLKIATELKRTVPACKSKLRRLNGQELKITSSGKDNNTHSQSNDTSVTMTYEDSSYDSGYNSSEDEDEVMKEKEEEQVFKNKKTKKTEKKSTLRNRSTDKKNASITKRRAPNNKKALH